MAKFELKPFHKNVPDEELLEDLLSVASIIGKKSVSGSEYNQHGRFSLSTIEKRFGGLNKALEKVGLIKENTRGITEDELFENLEEVWMKLGRQPIHTDMQRPLSRFGGNTYTRHFGSWRRALERFVEVANSDSVGDYEFRFSNSLEMKTGGRKTPRDPNWKLRYKVLARDGAKCRLCGKSSNEVKLHVDHIFPWSKGGETVLENLQILCEQCNIGKGNWD